MGQNIGREAGFHPNLLDIAHDTLYYTPIVKGADFLGSRAKKWVRKIIDLKWYNFLVFSPCYTTKLCFLQYYKSTNAWAHLFFRMSYH